MKGNVEGAGSLSTQHSPMAANDLAVVWLDSIQAYLTFCKGLSLLASSSKRLVIYVYHHKGK